MTNIEDIKIYDNAFNLAEEGYKVLFATKKEGLVRKLAKNRISNSIIFTSFDISSSIEKLADMVDYTKCNVLAIDDLSPLYRVGNNNSFSSMVQEVCDKLRVLASEKQIMLLISIIASEDGQRNIRKNQ